MTDTLPSRLEHRGPPEIAVETSALEAAAASLTDRGPDPEEPLDPIEHVRLRLEVDERVPDVTIAASLAQIASPRDPRERWLAAFGSPLGKYLASRGDDLNAALNALLALAPRPSG